MSLHEKIAQDAGIKQARVRCDVCHREQGVDGAACLRDGWPECHGYTMALLPKRAPMTQPPPAPRDEDEE